MHQRHEILSTYSYTFSKWGSCFRTVYVVPCTFICLIALDYLRLHEHGPQPDWMWTT